MTKIHTKIKIHHRDKLDLSRNNFAVDDMAAICRKYYFPQTDDLLELRKLAKEKLESDQKEYSFLRNKLGKYTHEFIPAGNDYLISLKTKYRSIGIEMKELKILLGCIKRRLTEIHVQNREFNKLHKSTKNGL